MPQNFAERLGWMPKSDSLRMTLDRALGYARERSHVEVTLEHMLLALIDDPNAATILEACQVDLVSLRTQVASFISSQLTELIAMGEGAPQASEPLKKVMAHASAAAEQSRRAQIDGAIVLAALIGEGESEAANILTSFGLTFEVAVSNLKRPQPQPKAQSMRLPAPQAVEPDRSYSSFSPEPSDLEEPEYKREVVYAQSQSAISQPSPSQPVMWTRQSKLSSSGSENKRKSAPDFSKNDEGSFSSSSRHGSLAPSGFASGSKGREDQEYPSFSPMRSDNKVITIHDYQPDAQMEDPIEDREIYHAIEKQVMRYEDDFQSDMGGVHHEPAHNYQPVKSSDMDMASETGTYALHHERTYRDSFGREDDDFDRSPGFIEKTTPVDSARRHDRSSDFRAPDHRTPNFRAPDGRSTEKYSSEEPRFSGYQSMPVREEQPISSSLSMNDFSSETTRHLYEVEAQSGIQDQRSRKQGSPSQSSLNGQGSFAPASSKESDFSTYSDDYKPYRPAPTLTATQGRDRQSYAADDRAPSLGKSKAAPEKIAHDASVDDILASVREIIGADEGGQTDSLEKTFSRQSGLQDEFLPEKSRGALGVNAPSSGPQSFSGSHLNSDMGVRDRKFGQPSVSADERDLFVAPSSLGDEASAQWWQGQKDSRGDAPAFTASRAGPPPLSNANLAHPKQPEGGAGLGEINPQGWRQGAEAGLGSAHFSSAEFAAPHSMQGREASLPPILPPQALTQQHPVPPNSKPGKKEKLKTRSKNKNEPGQLMIRLPKTLKVGSAKDLEIHVTQADLHALEQQVIGHFAPPEGGYTTEVLSLHLRAPEGGVMIEAHSPESQWIDPQFGGRPDDYIAWKWSVTALESGKLPLELIVALRIMGAQGVLTHSAAPEQKAVVRAKAGAARGLLKTIGVLIAIAFGGGLGFFAKQILASLNILQ